MNKREKMLIQDYYGIDITVEKLLATIRKLVDRNKIRGDLITEQVNFKVKLSKLLNIPENSGEPNIHVTVENLIYSNEKRQKSCELYALEIEELESIRKSLTITMNEMGEELAASNRQVEILEKANDHRQATIDELNNKLALLRTMHSNAATQAENSESLIKIRDSIIENKNEAIATLTRSIKKLKFMNSELFKIGKELCE